MLYLAPDAPNITGFPNVLSSNVQIKKPTWSVSLLQSFCKLETDQVGHIYNARRSGQKHHVGHI